MTPHPSAALGDWAPPAAPVGRLALERIADRLREAAIFSGPGDRRDEVLTIAEQLADLARQERRVAEQLEAAGSVQPWALRVGLRLKSPKAARLLHRLMAAPARFHHREILMRGLETSAGGLSTLIHDIRKGLDGLGLRAELQRVDHGYRLSRGAAEAIARWCSEEKIAARTWVRFNAVSTPAPDWADGTEHSPERSGAASDADSLAPAIRLLAVLHHSARRASVNRAPDAEWSRPPASGRLVLELICQRSDMTLHLILLLATQPGLFVPPRRLAEEIGCSRGSLTVLVCKLRRQFDAADLPNPIETVRGLGYRLTPPALEALSLLGASLRRGPDGAAPEPSREEQR